MSLADNKIENMCDDFSLRIVNMYDYLRDVRHHYTMSEQVLRSGTSIGANVSEGIFAQSKADFISKLHISLKEANETRYWLRLLRKAKYLPEDSAVSMLQDCENIIHVLVAILKTSKKNQEESKRTAKSQTSVHTN